MSEAIADVLRSQAGAIKDMHASGLADADSHVTWYHLWCVLTNLAHNIDGAGERSDNSWHLHKFVPKESDDAG